MNLAKIYYGLKEKPKNILQIVSDEPEWAVVRIQEGEKAFVRVKELEDAISIYCREEENEDFYCDKDAVAYFLNKFKDEI